MKVKYQQTTKVELAVLLAFFGIAGLVGLYALLSIISGL